ncbi:glycosyltransferase family 2 protein [Prolixibacteraceae bacterium Z1-6]|uniref:Glycosyltransferase family 2 protein n=1 Tax=Draconibacterium aestuarii TaxID=2998507 RepID=A0A9X3F202_9BACT|nr:glycosyltransferase family 2 protein [Prolixibacteraceae bacterium Z1-6]
MKKISIITATYNAAEYLPHLIESIIHQKNQEIEFIIIDGNSKDNTVPVIQKYEHCIDYWISEPDNGIYDAWNKGIKIAKGNWIMFLGADDKLKPHAIEKYKRIIDNTPNHEFHLISSKLEIIDKSGEFIRVKGWPWKWPNFLFEMMIAHPGALHSRKLFEEYNLFDTNYKITGDYELLLRAGVGLKTKFLNEITVEMREGGASDSINAIKEHKKAAILTGGVNKYYANVNYIYVFLKFNIKNFFRKRGINLYLKNNKS